MHVLWVSFKDRIFSAVGARVIMHAPMESRGIETVTLTRIHAWIGLDPMAIGVDGVEDYSALRKAFPRIVERASGVIDLASIRALFRDVLEVEIPQSDSAVEAARLNDRARTVISELAEQAELFQLMTYHQGGEVQ